MSNEFDDLDDSEEMRIIHAAHSFHKKKVEGCLDCEWLEDDEEFEKKKKEYVDAAVEVM